MHPFTHKLVAFAVWVFIAWEPELLNFSLSTYNLDEGPRFEIFFDNLFLKDFIY